jgi:hydrogenase/urease accessory protein HupE
MPVTYLRTWRLVLCLLAALPLLAQGHATRLSSSRLTVNGAQVTGIVEVNGLDLEVALGVTLHGLGGTLAPALLDTNRAKLSEYLLGNLRLEQSADKPCAAEVVEITSKQDHLVAEIRWQCSPSDTALTLVASLLQEIDPASKHMVTASGDVRTFALLSASNARLSLREREAKLGEVIWRYFLAGIEHIAIGYDHIAFLIAVVLWGRRFWPLAAVVTAFTLAHSVTLSLAVLDIVRLPPKLVELMIALSIMYVAAENFFVRDIGRRWIVAFLFGLIHGFGFASALREYGIPQAKVGWALGFFNLGVEVGQLVIVALALAALLAVDAWTQRRAEGRAGQRSRAVVWSVSAVIFLLGLFWAWERAAEWLT